MKPAGEVIEVNLQELQALLKQARQEPLGEEDYQKLKAALDALGYLTELIGDKDTTISRLRALLAKPSTEKTSKVLEQAGLEAHPKGSLPPSVTEVRQRHPLLSAGGAGGKTGDSAAALDSVGDHAGNGGRDSARLRRVDPPSGPRGSVL